VDQALRRKTLERFEQHRRAWDTDEALRTLYGRWYGLVREKLPPHELGPWLELGSGPGFAKNVIPELELSDVVGAPWLQHELDAEQLPFEDGSLGALVLFDVLHHLPHPARFLAEAVRTLRPGGRVVMCEPYVSPVSYPVYRFIHEERCDMSVDPLAEAAGAIRSRETRRSRPCCCAAARSSSADSRNCGSPAFSASPDSPTRPRAGSGGGRCCRCASGRRCWRSRTGSPTLPFG